MASDEKAKLKHIKATKKPLETPIFGCKFIEWSGHAQQQMSRRSITPAKVLLALTRPSYSNLPADYPHQRIEYRLTPKKWLQVVYDIQNDTLVVVTAYIEE